MTVGDEPVPFVIHRQPQQFGPAGQLQYWYMPPTELRGIHGADAELNFESIMLCRLLVMREQGWEHDPNEQCTFLMAYAYREFCRSKSLRQVVRDSFLPRGWILRGPPLPSSEQDRLAEACTAHDREPIRRELDQILGHQPFSRAEEVGFKAAFEKWLGIGLLRLRKDGSQGLQSWLQDMRVWMARYRRNSKTSPVVRKFVDYFGYQTKAAFFLCYASFWRQLIPWLVEHHGLDENSRRLLSLWHYQNQPVQQERVNEILIPEGTDQGTVDPEMGLASQRLWRIRLSRVGMVPDAFSGQVLSLHPLTWRLFSCNRLCDMLGRFLASPRFTDVTERGSAHDCPEYWGMVQAILESAMLYQLALQNYEGRRQTSNSRGRQNEVVIETHAAIPVTNTTEEVNRQLNDYFGQCLECGDLLTIARSPRPRRGARQIRITMQCRGCGQEFHFDTDANELRILFPESSEDEV